MMGLTDVGSGATILHLTGTKHSSLRVSRIRVAVANSVANSLAMASPASTEGLCFMGWPLLKGLMGLGHCGPGSKPKEHF